MKTIDPELKKAGEIPFDVMEKKVQEFVTENIYNPKKDESIIERVFNKENWKEAWTSNKTRFFVWIFMIFFVVALPFVIPILIDVKNTVFHFLETKISYLISLLGGGSGLALFAKKALNSLSMAWTKIREYAPEFKNLEQNLQQEENKIHAKVEEKQEVLNLQKEKLQKEKESLNTKKDDLSEKRNGLQKEYDKIEKEKDRIKDDLRDLRKQILELKRQKTLQREDNLLAHYINDRASSNDYKKHLGLPAQIRRDFDKLSRLVESFNKKLDKGLESEEDEHMINRIVLYVDDLDRCSTKKVVEVIEAVHLLLAFPLFTVVVAVDPRWLTQALQIEYKELFNGELALDTDGDGIPDLQRATPHDYLEKIFQISFWLYPMDVKGRRNMVETLTSNVQISNEREIINSLEEN